MLSATDLPSGRTLISNVRRIRRIDRHPVECDQDSAPESILDTENWLNWNCDLNNPNDSDDDSTAEVESDIERDNGIHDPESPEQRDVSTTPNIPGFILPTRKSERQAEMVMLRVNTLETRRNNGITTK